MPQGWGVDSKGSVRDRVLKMAHTLLDKDMTFQELSYWFSERMRGCGLLSPH